MRLTHKPQDLGNEHRAGASVTRVSPISKGKEGPTGRQIVASRHTK